MLDWTPRVLARRSTGCIVGSGISGAQTIYDGGVSLYAGELRRVSPFSVLRAMASSCSANLSSMLSIGGRSYSLSAACTTSAHAVGHAFELVRDGHLNVVIAGGGEHVSDIVAGAFNAMRTALSSGLNDQPGRASRPFDADRDGFVLAEGAGIVVLEELGHALERGAEIHAEVVGYGATSGGRDLVLPEADGRSAAACMLAALEDAGLDPSHVDCISAHATSTVAGDRAEAAAIAAVFGRSTPWISATKSMTGHSLGAAGVHDLILSLAMLEGGFVAPIVNLDRRGKRVRRSSSGRAARSNGPADRVVQQLWLRWLEREPRGATVGGLMPHTISSNGVRLDEIARAIGGVLNGDPEVEVRAINTLQAASSDEISVVWELRSRRGGSLQ